MRCSPRGATSWRGSRAATDCPCRPACVRRAPRGPCSCSSSLTGARTMTLKRWVLGKVNEGPRHLGSRVPPNLRGEPLEPTVAAPATVRDAEVTHLGPYGALIGAIRAELEHFAAGPLRLHLAIAEGDRYVLTSIEVECEKDE